MVYDAENLKTIVVGQQGENLANIVLINVKCFTERWPDAEIVLLLKRHNDTAPYIASTQVQDGILLWPVTKTDTRDAGNGRMEIRALVDGKVAKTIVANFHVNESITPPTEEAPAGADWIEKAVKDMTEAKRLARSNWMQNDEDAVDYVRNRPGMYDIAPSWEVEWDGNAEGKTVVELGSYAKFVKIADEPIPTSLLRTQKMKEESPVSVQESVDYNFYLGTEWDDGYTEEVGLREITDGVFMGDGFVSIPKDNMEVNEILFPEKGIYMIVQYKQDK